MIRKSIVVIAIMIAMYVLHVQHVTAQSHKNKSGSQRIAPRDYRSRHYYIHTDLSPTEANALLARMETMLSLISTYWGRPPRGLVECYVVKDLKNWPNGAIHPDGLDSIEAGGGLTRTGTLSVNGELADARSVVYAVADRGTPLHEAVHAYCGQTCGRLGPKWYAEGMAEMGQYWRKNDSSVKIHDVVLEYLKSSKPKSLHEIVAPVQQTGDSWRNYAWRWALCHLLANNPNYAPRFRPLGMALLNDQPASFEQTYGAMAGEISFEYTFFLNHIEQGFRVDLCAWDWSREFKPLKHSARSLAPKVDARSGWQPTGLQVAEGHQYTVETTGKWKTSKGAQVNADGARDGKGRLHGVVMRDWQLGKPFALGANGTFTSPDTGNLYVRCYDNWNAIADNSGRISMKMKFVSETADADAPIFASSLRTWKDITGSFSIAAELVSVQDGMVELKRSNGDIITVPLTKLSKKDQAYLKQKLPSSP